MKQKKRFQRISALLLMLCLLTALLPQAAAMPSSFFEQHSDWHFDLTKEPDRAMTVEEYIALVRAYSYWSVGIDGESPRDRDGDLPSPWAAPYVREAAKYGIIDPATVDYSQTITLGMAMEIIVHSKGLFGYNAINLYEFRSTEGLTNEQRLCLNTAVDYGILQYTPKMNVSTQLLRRDLEAKYLIPSPSTVLSPVTGQKQRAANYRYSMAFFEDCYNDAEKSREQLNLFKQNSDSFNVVSLDCIYLMQNKVNDANDGRSYIGEFITHDLFGEEDPQLELLAFCKEKDISVLGGVIVYYDDSILRLLAADDAAIDAAIDEMIEVVDEYDLDGLNFDVEINGNTYRAVYSKLVTKLSARLHAEGKMLMLTVGGYMWDKNEATTIYDYDVIAQAADLATIITYDLHSARSYTNDPTAQAGEISNLTYTSRCMRYAATVIGADKVLLGIGGYGICFNTTDHTAKNITMPEVWALREKYKAQEKTTDAATDDRYFTYAEGGKNYIVYYESEAGIRRRAALAPAYGIAGVAGFYVGGSYTEMFDQMKKKLTDLPFTDADPTQWYYEGVEYAYKNKLFNGMSATTFEPETEMTRAMLVTVLWRYEGEPQAQNGVQFVDVPSNEWYAKAVAWASENGIVGGIGHGKFAPEDNVTREQMAAILYRYAQKKGYPTANRADLSAFPDHAAVSNWAKDAVSWTVSAGIIGGSDGYLLPEGNATRAQVATILMRFIRNILA